MPSVNSKLHSWKKTQLSTGAAGLDAKIWKEIAENKGSTWSDRKVRLKSALRERTFE
jgi:hypothetical protein